VQGPERARPYTEKANADFTTVVDEENMLGDHYGFKAIPNGYLVDETGVVLYKELSGFDVKKPRTRALVEEFATSGGIGNAEQPESDVLDDTHTKANAHFRTGEKLYREGKVDEAIAEWRKTIALEPDNYVIRKQIWAVQNPDRFYSGNVDYDWQAEQLKQGL
ncbi:MAG: thioredoxin family protein, partial [Chloroflexi bacterium]|nr:thioredoxin family protein [Chloroflexota bacterium]